MDTEELQAKNAETDETFRRLMEAQHALFQPESDAIVLATGAGFAWRIPTSVRDTADRRMDSFTPTAFSQTAELASIAAGVASQCVRIEHDEELSEVGKATAKQKVLEKHLPEAQQRVDWIRKYNSELEAAEAKFYAADAVAPNDMASAMADYEIRQRFYALDENGKLAFIDERAKDVRVLSALVRSPLPLHGAEKIPGFLRQRLTAHFGAHKDAQNPVQAKGLKQWRTCAEFAKTVADQVAPTLPQSAMFKRRPGSTGPGSTGPGSTKPRQKPAPLTRAQFDALHPSRRHAHATGGGAVTD
jgi:hypothetical protein